MLAVAQCEWLLCCAAHDDQLSVAACCAHDTAHDAIKLQNVNICHAWLLEQFTQQICTAFQTKLKNSILIERSVLWSTARDQSRINAITAVVLIVKMINVKDFLKRKSNGDVTRKFTVSSSLSLYHTHTLIHTHAIYIIARMAKLLVKCSLPSVTWSGAVY